MRTTKQRIALFGIEQHLGGILNDMETPQYTIHCISMVSTERLSDFDSVIVFQGAFERFEEHDNYLGTSCWITCDTDELDRRFKEIVQVYKKGGFVLVIQTRPFCDFYGGRTYTDTDISKRLLNFNGLYRHDLPNPVPYVFPLKGELKDFCDKFGRGYSYFQINGDVDYLPLVKVSEDKIVGLSLFRRIYFISSLLPKYNEWEGFLKDITNAISSIHKKRSVELPEWVGRICLSGEKVLRDEISKYEEGARMAKDRLVALMDLKRVLVESGEDLVKSVSRLLFEITGLTIDSVDNKKEDCRLVAKSGKVLAIVEVKGVNGNIKLSHVSQAFEHRERSPGYEKLPVILIANTFIGTARSEEEKDKPPEDEQVKLAEKHGVLILRTLDLLRIYNSVASGQEAQEGVVRQLLSKVGWWGSSGDSSEGEM